MAVVGVCPNNEGASFSERNRLTPNKAQLFATLYSALSKGDVKASSEVIGKLMNADSLDPIEDRVREIFANNTKLNERVMELSRGLLDIGTLGPDLRRFLRAVQTGSHHLQRVTPRLEEVREHGILYFLRHLREAGSLLKVIRQATSKKSLFG